MDMDTRDAQQTFIGDGQYTNDGGSDLQRLWDLWNWTEIKNCPGRYVTKKNVEAQQTPLQNLIVDRLNVTGRIMSITTDHTDHVETIHFEGGGGVITYCKCNGTFVHTLNTESGYDRKMRALGLEYE